MVVSTRVLVCICVVCVYRGIEATSTSQLSTGSTEATPSQEPLVGSSVTIDTTTMTDPSTATGSFVATDPSIGTGSPVMTNPSTGTGSSEMTESSTGTGSSGMTDPSMGTRSSAMMNPSMGTGSSVMTEPSVGTGSSVTTDPSVATDSSAMTKSSTGTGSSVMTDSSVATGSSVTAESVVTSDDTMSSDYTGTSTMSSDSSSTMSSDRSPQPTSSSPTTQAQQTTIATSTASPISVPKSSPTTAGMTPGDPTEGPADTSYFNIVVSVAIIGGVLAFLTIATICIYFFFLKPKKKKSASFVENSTKTNKKKKRKNTSLQESDVSELIIAIDKQSKPLEMATYDNNSFDGDMETVQVHKENVEMRNGVELHSDPKAGDAAQSSKKTDSNDANNVRISIHRELLEMTKLRNNSQESGETTRQMSTFGKAGVLDRSASTVSSISLKGITSIEQGHGLSDNSEDTAGGGKQEESSKELVRQDAILSDLSVEIALPESGHSETELKADNQQEREGTKQLVRQDSFAEDSVSEGAGSEPETTADTQQENGATNDQKSVSSTEHDTPERGHSESDQHSDSLESEGETKLASHTANDNIPGPEDSVPELEMQAVINAVSGYVQEVDNSGNQYQGHDELNLPEESYSRAYEREVYEEDDLESVDEDGQGADGGSQVDPEDGQAIVHTHMDIDAMIQERVGDGLSNVIMSTRL